MYLAAQSFTKMDTTTHTGRSEDEIKRHERHRWVAGVKGPLGLCTLSPRVAEPTAVWWRRRLGRGG